MLKGIRVTVDVHKPIAIPRSNSYTTTAVQVSINSIICPDLQLSWQCKHVLGPTGGGQMGVRTSRTQGRAGQGPVEAEPATRFPVAHDGRSQVHQAATPVNHFVKIRLCFRTPFQDSGESAHTHILPILQAPHLGCARSQVLQSTTRSG